jgi:diguanylate cyclase (GGDEF)-like protein
LRERSIAEDAVATCIPINILGVPAAVLHAVYEPESSHPAESDIELGDGVRSLEGVAVRFGNRLGMMRAMAQSHLQAETDPLTGLINRRAMENRVRELRSDDVSFALALVDLDHFKDLNDTYGHDTGDRALRLFARVARNTVRDGDIVCRHGGEEFLIVLPGADVPVATPVLHRLRERLAEVLTGAQLPAFTMSAGIVDSSWADELPDLVDRADRALMQAKAAGRDRIVIGDDAPIARPTTPSTESPMAVESTGRPVALSTPLLS